MNYFKCLGLLFVILFFIPPIITTAQNLSINGKVFDKDSHEAIPYVNIVDINSGRGTSSNFQGEFILLNVKLPLKLVLTHLSYNSDTVQINDYSAELKIILQPSIQYLPEITINTNSYARFLIDEAVKKINAQKNAVYYGNAFYRFFTYVDERPQECQEIAYNIMTNPFRVLRASIIQGRYALDKSIHLQFRNFSIFTRGLSLFNGDDQQGYYIDKNIDSVTLEIIGYLESMGKGKIAQVKISSKKDRVNAILTIDTENFNIYRFFYTNYAKLIDVPPLHKFKEEKNEFDVSFIALNDSIIRLNYIDIKITSIRLNYIDIKITSEIGFKFQTNKMISHSHTYFYNLKSNKPTDITYDDHDPKVTDRESIDKIKYDSDFWKDNPIFKRTNEEEKVIESFERKKSFGKILE